MKFLSIAAALFLALAPNVPLRLQDSPVKLATFVTCDADNFATAHITTTEGRNVISGTHSASTVGSTQKDCDKSASDQFGRTQ